MLESVSTEETKMLVLNVPEMSCGHCVATIEKAVHSVDPAARIAADLGSKSVRVESTAGADAIRQALDAAGYESALA